MNPNPIAPKPSRADQSRINGAKSKGPITIGGKARSSQNALRHGFAAKANLLIAPDDSEAWHAHLAGYRDSYRPVNYQESEFVDQLASIGWRQARLVAIETALIDFQLSVQEDQIDTNFPTEEGNPYLHLALAWQGLARKAYPRLLPADPNEPNDPTAPPDSLDVDSIELVRRYQVSLDRQFRNTLLNFRQYRKDFAPTPPPISIEIMEAAAPNEPKPRVTETQKPEIVVRPPRPIEPKAQEQATPAAPDPIRWPENRAA